MPSVTPLFQIQAGKETTWGTPVNPTAKLMGIEEFTVTPKYGASQHPDLRASLAPAFISTLNTYMAEGKVKSWASYEDLPYWLDSLFGEATPSGTGPYVYAYNGPTTAAPSRRKMTLVKGDASQVYGMNGALVKSLTIKGETGQPWTLDVELVGHSVATDATAALSNRTVEFVMGHHTDLYIDTWGGTIGTTQITSPFFAFELKLESSVMPYHSMRSSSGLAPINFADAERFTGELKLTVEVDTTTDDYLVALLTASTVTQRQIRIVGTSSTKVAQLNFAGTLTETPDVFGDKDGIVTLDYGFVGEYNSTLGNWFTASITNSVSALP